MALVKSSSVFHRSSGLANLDTSPSSGESEQTWLTQLGRYLSQLWFGNLVGVAWWDSAWLQQGFATYYQYAAVLAVSPQAGEEEGNIAT